VELPQGLGLGTSWNLLWSWSRPKIHPKSLLIFQRINHFVDSKQLTRKDLLKRNLARLTDLNVSGNGAMSVSGLNGTGTGVGTGAGTGAGTGTGTGTGSSNKYSQFYEIMPKTFLLPNEYTSFVREFTAIEALKQQQQTLGFTSNDPFSGNTSAGNTTSSSTGSNIWIMKPVGLSRGRGISLINDISSLTYSQNSVIQKYLENPMCLNDYKFDLRLYVLVTSFHPLEAFVYKEGFARVSTEKYSINAANLKNKFIHLTNSSIQKHNTQQHSQHTHHLSQTQQTPSSSGTQHTHPSHHQHSPHSSDNPIHHGDMNESNGSKIPLLGPYGLWKKLEERGYDITSLWTSISSLIVKSLLAVDDKIEYQPCSFELFGYDILIDSNGRPWLIEVNSSPSLDRGTQLDVRIKNELISDIIRLVDPIPFNRTELIQILRKRLKELQSKTYSLSTSASTSSANGNGNSRNNGMDQELENHLKAILKTKSGSGSGSGNGREDEGDEEEEILLPRQYGEEPLHFGQFERLCPNTKIFATSLKVKNKLVKEAP
jgi:tubulin polyglutamylase TTLL5